MSFSGVIAFIYADLIIIPLILIYLRYYGPTVTVRMVAIMFAAMVAAALAVDGIFSALGIIPSARPSIESITGRGIGWNYTTYLNIIFFVIAGGLMALTVRRGARDPVCGMTVDRSKTPVPVGVQWADCLFLQRWVQGEFRRGNWSATWILPGEKPKPSQHQAFDLVPATPAAAVRASGQAWTLPPTPGD